MPLNILEDLHAIQNRKLNSKFEEVRQLVEKDCKEEAYTLLNVLGYTTFQAIVLVHFILEEWYFNDRLNLDFFDDLNDYLYSNLSAIQVAYYTKETIQNFPKEHLISSCIKEHWNHTAYIRGNHNCDEVIGLTCNSYLTFVAILDGIPILINNDFVQYCRDPGTYHEYLYPFNICILPQIPDNLIPIPNLVVELQLKDVARFYCPYYIGLEYTLEEEAHTTTFNFILDSLTEESYLLRIDFCSPKTDNETQTLLSFNLPKKSTNPEKNSPFPLINKAALLTITNESSIENFKKTAKRINLQEIEKMDADLHLLYWLLANFV